MSSSDDSQSKYPVVVNNHSSLDNISDNISNLPEDEQLRNSLDMNEDIDQDEEIDDEPQLDDDEQSTPVSPINNDIPIINTTFPVKKIHFFIIMNLLFVI